jgi:hypothetical protein
MRMAAIPVGRAFAVTLSATVMVIKSTLTPILSNSFLMALVGTAFSFGIAIAAGNWAHPESLATLARAQNSN